MSLSGMEARKGLERGFLGGGHVNPTMAGGPLPDGLVLAEVGHRLVQGHFPLHLVDMSRTVRHRQARPPIKVQAAANIQNNAS